MKSSIMLISAINTNINKGDSVKVFDGSAFSPVNNRDPHYIIYNIEGYCIPIKDMEAIVIATGVTNYAVEGVNYYYIQDILIDIKGHLFRTCSKFVYKLN